MMRTVWLTLGLLSLVLAGVGVLLPLLPTVPFLLLAAFGFARSSERLHHWLLSHPALGHPIADWRKRGAISRRAKHAVAVSVLVAFGISLAIGVGLWILFVQAVSLTLVTLFVWTRPHA